MSRISIVGTGYVGLVTGACFADRGHEVVCIDVDPAKVDAINARRAPFFEKGLGGLLERNVGRRLGATTDLAAAVAGSDVTFIAVGTPAVNGRIDLSYVVAAAEQIGAALKSKSSRHLVVVKSTVIPGTTDGPVRAALERTSGKRAGVDFGLGMNPEFLTEGRAVDDFMHPDRIVVGAGDAATHAQLAALYDGFEGAPRIGVNNSTAEMIKYASNCMLATMISFANEISRLCTAVGDVDVAKVTAAVHESTYLTVRDASGSRVKAPLSSFLEAGCGFGGSCLPKDVTALAAQGAALGLETPMLRAVLEINRSQPAELLRLIERHYPDLTGVAVTVLGLAFKPDTDDVRESPAFPVLTALRERGADISAYDPIAWPAGHSALAGVRRAGSLEDAVARASVVVIVTRWDAFLRVPDLLRGLPCPPLVVDGRRMLDPATCARYEGIGRGHGRA